MRATILNRIVLVAAIVTVSLVGMSILTNAQEQRQQNQKQQDTKKQKDKKQSQQQDKKSRKTAESTDEAAATADSCNKRKTNLRVGTRARRSDGAIATCPPDSKAASHNSASSS